MSPGTSGPTPVKSRIPALVPDVGGSAEVSNIVAAGAAVLAGRRLGGALARDYKGVPAFIRGVALDNHCVETRLKRHDDPGLEPAGVVDVGNLDAGSLEAAAGEQPQPGVVRRALTSGQRVGLGIEDVHCIIIVQ